MTPDAFMTIHGDDAPRRPQPSARRPADVAYRRAFLALLLFPVSFVAAFVVGEGLFSIVAADPQHPAVWSVLVAGLPALVLFAVPAGLAWFLGRQAGRLGRPDGRTPALIGVVVVAAFVGVNALSYVAGLIFD